MKTATLPEFLTDEQIAQCVALYPDRHAILAQVVVPNMAEINRKLGQENDPGYIAWAIIYVLGASKAGAN